MAGTAAQPEQDDALLDGFAAACGHRSSSQQVGQRQSANAKDARLNKAAPRDPIAISGATAGDSEHDILIQQILERGCEHDERPISNDACSARVYSSGTVPVQISVGAELWLAGNT